MLHKNIILLATLSLLVLGGCEDDVPTGPSRTSLEWIARLPSSPDIFNNIDTTRTRGAFFFVESEEHISFSRIEARFWTSHGSSVNVGDIVVNDTLPLPLTSSKLYTRDIPSASSFDFRGTQTIGIARPDKEDITIENITLPGDFTVISPKEGDTVSLRRGLEVVWEADEELTASVVSALLLIEPGTGIVGRPSGVSIPSSNQRRGRASSRMHPDTPRGSATVTIRRITVETRPLTGLSDILPALERVAIISEQKYTVNVVLVR